MKVILLRDVAKIGRRHQVVEVPDGFAQNKLIPMRDAEPATVAAIKRLKDKALKSGAHKSAEEAALSAVVDAVILSPLCITMEANAQGHLFQSVHKSEVLAAAKVRQLSLPAAYLTVPVIKEIGVHNVFVQIGTTVRELPIKVLAK